MRETLMRLLCLLLVSWFAPWAIAQAPKGFTNRIGMKLVLIPSGTFIMGSPAGEEGRNADELQHEVTISKEYYIGAYEVTQAQYRVVMGHNPSKFQGVVVDHENATLPVDTVRWEDAVEFCRRLSELDPEETSGKVYRLPTEAEWEYACRAGSTTVYSFGDEKSLVSEYGWFNNNSSSRPHTVGLKEANAWGLYDMHGNVWEWCGDYGWAYPHTAVKDPQGPVSGDSHVLRGGSWNRGAYDCRSAGLRGNLSRIGYSSCGFRVVLGYPISTRVVEPKETHRSENKSMHSKQVINRIGMQLTLIPRGTFIMGSPDSEPERSDDESLHEVTISKDYYIGIHEVTQEQYLNVTGVNPSIFQKPRVDRNTASRPVENISWEEAVEFCNRLSEFPEEKAAGRVYRLPTEAEWEYACRAGTKTAFSFVEKGDLLPGYPWYHRHGWFEPNSSAETNGVGLKEANAWGLYDMHGNVWEWCWDRYGEYPNEPVADPQGPDQGLRRVQRGGSYLLGFEDLCRSASRFGAESTYRRADIGFRVAMDLLDSPKVPKGSIK